MAKLGDIATYINGYAFKPSDWSTEGLPIIRIQDLTGSSYKTNKYNGDYDKKYEVNNGDILISWSASLGVFVWKNDKAVLNQHIFKVIFNKKVVDKDFFVYQVENILRKAQNSVHGATMKHLTKPVFDSLDFYLPLIEEQKRIAKQLKLINLLIDHRNDQIKKLDLLVKSRFIEMFGDISTNTKGWNQVPLGELCDISRGGSPRPINNFLGGTVPWIKIGDATDGDNIYLTKTKEHIIEDGVKKSHLVKKGSLIFANCGVSLGFARIITFDGCIHDGWLAFENISASIDKRFLLLTLNMLTKYFRNIAPDGTQPNLNTSIMKKHKQIVPPLTLQKEFISFVAQVDKSKLAIQQSLYELETLKKSLMQQYFG